MIIVVDAGGLIAAERGSNRLALLHKLDRNAQFIVPVCVVAQVWRDGRRQARLARFLNGCEIVGVAADAGQRLGALLGAAATDDVVDATVIDTAVQYSASMVATSDPADMRRLVQTSSVALEIVAV